jgi:hypothetical protein
MQLIWFHWNIQVKSSVNLAAKFTHNTSILFCYSSFPIWVSAFFIIKWNYFVCCMYAWWNLGGTFFLFSNEINSFHEHKIPRRQHYHYNCIPNGPEDNKRHSNLMFFIGYIPFLIYCTVLRTCVLSEKSSISFLTRFIFIFYMKVFKTTD